MSVSPDYFDKFHDVISKYMKRTGEGDTKASQIVTAVNKCCTGGLITVMYSTMKSLTNGLSIVAMTYQVMPTGYTNLQISQYP